MSASSDDRANAPLEGVAATRWQKIRLVIKVVELRLRFVALMACTGLAFAYWDELGNYYDKWTRPSAERVVTDAAHEFYCPMHPSVVQSDPGNCPICGMPLSKRIKGRVEALPKGVVARVQLAPMRVAQGGIRTAEIGYEPLAETISTVGFVAFDERNLKRISSRTKGLARVEKLMVDFTGMSVAAGQPLAELYSPELYQAIRELLLARRTAAETEGLRGSLGRDALGGRGEGDFLAMSREKLGLWGVAPEQVDKILTVGKADYRLPILSPLSGVVVRKNVVEGQYVTEGDALFEVADLSRVWVQAQIYEDQIDRVRVGQAVQATVEAFPGEAFAGTVAFIDPALDPTTRTVNVRYDLPNPDGRLRPGMYAVVTFHAPVADMPTYKQRLAKSKADVPRPRMRITRAIRTVDEQKTCPVTKAKLGSMGDPIPVAVKESKVWGLLADCTAELTSHPTRYLADDAPAPAGGVISVPESAVVDDGVRQIVYVETDPGVFEGRVVVLGRRVGDRYPVVSGLEPGDRVAAAGAFLIDAESRLNAGAPGPLGEPTR